MHYRSFQSYVFHRLVISSVNCIIRIYQLVVYLQMNCYIVIRNPFCTNHSIPIYAVMIFRFVHLTVKHFHGCAGARTYIYLISLIGRSKCKEHLAGLAHRYATTFYRCHYDRKDIVLSSILELGHISKFQLQRIGRDIFTLFYN